MPMYDFKCGKCKKTFEARIAYDLSNMPQRHRDLTDSKCEGQAEKLLSAPHIRGAPHQVGLIMNSGKKVPGHFGKEAKRNRRKR